MTKRVRDWPALMKPPSMADCLRVAARIHIDQLPKPTAAVRTLETAAIIQDWLAELMERERE